MLKEYRHINIPDKQTEAVVLSTIEKYDYITLADSKQIIVFILSPSEQTTTAMFKKMMKVVPSYASSIIFISQYLFQTHVSKKVDEHQFENKHIKIYNYSYVHFKLELPKSSLVQPHIICTDEELEELKKNYVFIDRLPKILQSEGPVIWLGGKPGQVIKILRYSENALIVPYYRYVI